MKPISEVRIRVIDHGIFLPFARCLAREAAHVDYYTPSEKAFPTIRDCCIGDGFDEVEKIVGPMVDSDSVDCWCFPDVGFEDVQADLLDRGKVVWGARNGDSLEIHRGKFLKALATTDLPVPPHQIVVGLDKLRQHLYDKEDKWVKISKLRGDFETFHWRNWEMDKAELDKYGVRFGPAQERITFYVFDPIDTEIEDGVDTYCIDGKFPELVIHGMEAKDRAFLAAFQNLANLPEEVRKVSEAFAPILGAFGYRQFFSSEVRITPEKQSYFIDPTTRLGSPPSQVMCEMYGNLADIVWHGANGVLIEPEPLHKYGVQAIICGKGDRDTWSAYQFPEELDQWVKCGFCCRIDGLLCFPPDPDATSNDIGWLVGVGDSIKEAIEHLKEHAGLLPDGVTCEHHHLADLIDEVNEADEAGVPFTEDAVPEPEIVVK